MLLAAIDQVIVDNPKITKQAAFAKLMTIKEINYQDPYAGLTKHDLFVTRLESFLNLPKATF